MANLPYTKIVFCTCDGYIAGRLPLDHISQFLEGVAPDIEIEFSDNLCRGQFSQNTNKRIDARRPLVVGACAELKLNTYLLAESNDFLGFLHPAYIVDLLTLANVASHSKAIVERLKLLLWAKIMRVNVFRGIGQDNIKASFSFPSNRVTRRQFLMAAMPKCELVPSVEKSKCHGEGECGLCINMCPNVAISVQGAEVFIDGDQCNGCGACVTFCPHGAIYYPTFSLEESNSELEGLLLNNDVDLKPRVIAFVCETCLSAIIDNHRNHIAYPDNILPISVPCLAMVSPWLILRAFDLGGQGVVLISGEDGCQHQFGHAMWESNVEFMKALLNSWQIPNERVKLIKFYKNKETEQSDLLNCFADEIANLQTTPFKLTDHTVFPDNQLGLLNLIRGMHSRVHHATSRSITTGQVPFGKLILDNTKCTGCGLCAINCPVSALTISQENNWDHFELLFQQNLCIGCNKCVNACPEKCLQLQHILELDKIWEGAYSLFSDGMFRCRNCGEQVAPISMIVHLKTKLRNMDSTIIEQIELCNRCKMEIQNSRFTNKIKSLHAEVGMNNGIPRGNSQVEE